MNNTKRFRTPLEADRFLVSAYTRAIADLRYRRGENLTGKYLSHEATDSRLRGLGILPSEKSCCP